VEGDLEGDAWITENIIKPVFGKGHTPKNTSYCLMGVARWLRLAGFHDCDGMASVGKVLYNWAPRVGAHVYPNKPKARDVRKPIPGDIVLHQGKPNGWHGHGMLCLGYDADSGRVLVMEANHSKSMGPSGKAYTFGTYGEDQTRRAGIGMRWLHLDDPYISCWLRVPSVVCSVEIQEKRTTAHGGPQ
jgi:hypothetical protein